LKPLVELSHGAFQHRRLGLPIFVFMNVNAVAGELGADIGITFGFAKLGHLLKRPAATSRHDVRREPRNASAEAGCSNEMLQKAGLANKDGKYGGEARHRAGAGGRG
jgi:hypothetical protein